MIDGILTDELAKRCLAWRLAPGRYIKSGRGWIPRSKFRPLVDIRDAFQLLDALAADCSLVRKHGRVCIVTVDAGGRKGRATAPSEARAISLAIAKILGLAPEPGSAADGCTHRRPHGA